jgi:LPS export ABC transporter protein LptC
MLSKIRLLTKPSRTRIYAAAVLILLAAGAVGILFYFSNSGEQGEMLKIIPENVDLQIRNIHFTEVGDPDLKWELQADSGRYVRKDNLAYFDKVRIKLITSGGKSYTMTGESGILHTDSNDAEITGNVHVVSDRGDRFKTDRLLYSSSDRIIHTDGKVFMEGNKTAVNARGMKLYVKEEKVSLLSGVQAVISK